MTEAERQKLILNAYDRLKQSFTKFKKPNGDQDYPAKTCKDLFIAYPDLESGIYEQLIKIAQLIN